MRLTGESICSITGAVRIKILNYNVCHHWGIVYNCSLLNYLIFLVHVIHLAHRTCSLILVWKLEHTVWSIWVLWDGRYGAESVTGILMISDVKNCLQLKSSWWTGRLYHRAEEGILCVLLHTNAQRNAQHFMGSDPGYGGPKDIENLLRRIYMCGDFIPQIRFTFFPYRKVVLLQCWQGQVEALLTPCDKICAKGNSTLYPC